MKKLAIVAVSLLLAANTAFADIMDPFSTTSLMFNPAHSWYPTNIYNSSYNSSSNYRRGYRTHTGYYTNRRTLHRYNVCIRYAGGVACRSYLY